MPVSVVPSHRVSQAGWRHDKSRYGRLSARGARGMTRAARARAPPAVDGCVDDLFDEARCAVTLTRFGRHNSVQLDRVCSNPATIARLFAVVRMRNAAAG